MFLKPFLTAAAMALIVSIPHITAARNVDLSTVPKRNTVQLTIYNSEDLTLVRDTRTVTFKKGVNPLQFSWANTLIDPTSVQLRFLSNPEKLDVLDTTFPHDKPQMLYWSVQSDFDGEATIEITYFTSGITWSADYTCIAGANEKALALEGFVRVTNNSGEEYEDAHVRLVVGKINLVEKIAQLAAVFLGENGKGEKSITTKLKQLAAAQEMLNATTSPASSMMPATRPQEPKEIAKESLSDYFIFSIEGTETIPNGWSKRMRSVQAGPVPVRVQYRYRPQEYGEQLVRMYLLTNDKDSKLGTAPLPDGIVRVFRNNGRGGLSYLTAQSIKYIPIGDKIELNLGADPNVLFELIKLKAWRDDIWMQVNGANIFRHVGQPGLRIEANTSVAGWDDHEVYAQRVRNFTAVAIDVEVRRPFYGDVIFRSQLKPLLHDYQTVQFNATVDAGKKSDLLFQIIRGQGHNSKQNNVKLEAAEVVR